MLRALVSPSVQQLLLGDAARCVMTSSLPVAAACYSTGAPAAPPAITQPTKKAANPQDYSLVMKKAYEISAASVVPAGNAEVGLVAGIPLDTYKRKARIYSSAKSASQSGLAKTLHNSAAAPAWRIGFETTSKWENPLMGWTSSADPLENVARASLFFYTKEEAIAFCKKHGWQYSLDVPNQRRPDRQKRYAGYSDNFSVKRKGVPDLSHLPSVRLGLGTPPAAAAAAAAPK